MMKTTPWKLFDGGNQRIRVTYGLDYAFASRNNQEPYFSATCDIEEKHGIRWIDSGGGAAHELIGRHFPELRPYLKWHLVSTGEPMHYIANAQYWWEKMNGSSRWPAQAGEPNPKDAFLHTIIFGGIPGEKLRDTSFWAQMEPWLRERFQKLMGHFAADMETLGVLG